MGMSLSSGKGAKSEINVTPLVDVCLVLLIIFMVLVPRSVPETSVRIPPTRQRPAQERTIAEDALIVAASEDGGLTLSRRPISPADLPAELSRQLAFRDVKLVFVDVADRLPYGDAVTLIDRIKGAGAEVVAILKKKDEVIPATLR